MQQQLKNLKPETRSRPFNIKVTETEYTVLQTKAQRYTDGNISAWVRYAALNLQPKPEDVVGGSDAESTDQN